MMFRQIVILLFSGTAVLMAGAAWPGTLKVNLVLSDNSPPYRQFADAFSGSLRASKAEVDVTETRDVHGADLIVAVGMMAAELSITRSETPVLAVMIPDDGLRALLDRFSRKVSARSISAVYMNQPWERQLDFLQAAFPERRRIGLVYSPGTLIDLADLRRQIAGRGGSLVTRQVSSAEKLFPSLERVFDASDLLLAIPDNAIYNSSSIRNILLTSYRKGVPLVGLSQSYVNAGALCAFFSTNEQMAGQAGALVISFYRNGKLPEPQYPAEFTISVNRQVSRSMGIELPSAEAIQIRLGKAIIRE